MKGMISLDVGTTAVKAALFTENLEFRGLSIREYTLLTPSPEMLELDAAVYWDNTVLAVRELLSKTGFPVQDIAVITCTTQGETFIPVDKNANPLANAVVWLDSRAQEEGNYIASQYTKEAFYAKTGIPEVNAYTPVAKLLWFKKHKNEIYQKTCKFLLLEDYLIARFSGVFVTNPSIMCSTGYLDIASGQTWTEILEFCGIDPGKIPDIIPCGAVAGALKAEAAELLGLPAGIIVSTGAMDQAAAAIGSGNIREGILAETTGTAMVVTTTTDRPRTEPWKPVCVYTHGIAGKFLNIIVVQAAGIVYKWFRDTFCADLPGPDQFAQMDKLAMAEPPGSKGLLLYPHFTGTQFPLTNNKIRGSFVGVGLDTNRGCFLRAIMESIAYALRECIEFLEIPEREIRSLGGGSKSSLWNQIKADITETDVSTMKVEEASLLGAALLGGTAAGVFSDMETICAGLSQSRVFKPNPSPRDVYNKAYGKYKQLYSGLESFF
jgi:xylulokinase